MTSFLPLPTKCDEEQFLKLIEVARNCPLDAFEVARLAKHLAASGEKLQWGDHYNVADIASTGGPASLSTLLGPLWLRVMGFQVAKLAVPGRPAGAIDSLGTLEGYKVQLASDEVHKVIEDCGYAHFLADSRFAPLDASLFMCRRRHDAVAIPVLAAASLLAKKLAVGVKCVGLDIRIGSHGNFGKSRAEARKNATMFCEAARLLGISAVAFLGVKMAPLQPWIGRGESLVALAKVLNLLPYDDDEIWLENHSIDCYCMAACMSDSPDLERHEQERLSPNMICDARRVFESHLIAQGTSIHVFIDRTKQILSAPRFTLKAESSGFFQINLARLRDVLVSMQTVDGHNCFKDPAGVKLLVMPGEAVVADQPIATLRCDTCLDIVDVISRVKSAFSTLADNSSSILVSVDLDQQMEVINA